MLRRREKFRAQCAMPNRARRCRGANVVIDGTQRGAVTDANGFYVILLVESRHVFDDRVNGGL